jgi:hypothetical protein
MVKGQDLTHCVCLFIAASTMTARLRMAVALWSLLLTCIGSADALVVTPSVKVLMGVGVGLGTSHHRTGQRGFQAVFARRRTKFVQDRDCSTCLQAAASASDWTQLKDEASGNVYYWNQATGETSWEQPPPRDSSKTPEAEAPKKPASSPKADSRGGGSGGGMADMGGLFSVLFALPEAVEDTASSSAEYMANQEATLTEFAVPVAGDDSEVAIFRSLIARTSLEKRGLQVVYDAERDGWHPQVTN